LGAAGGEISRLRRGDIRIRGVRLGPGLPRVAPVGWGGFPFFEGFGFGVGWIVRGRLLGLGVRGVRGRLFIGGCLIDRGLNRGCVFALGRGGSDRGLATAALLGSLLSGSAFLQSGHELFLDALRAQPPLLEQLLELSHAQALQQPGLDERLHHGASIPPVSAQSVMRLARDLSS
jgi:hypothetical protein